MGEPCDIEKAYGAHFKKRVTVFTEYHGTFATMVRVMHPLKISAQ